MSSLARESHYHFPWGVNKDNSIRKHFWSSDKRLGTNGANKLYCNSLCVPYYGQINIFLNWADWNSTIFSNLAFHICTWLRSIFSPFLSILKFSAPPLRSSKFNICVSYIACISVRIFNGCQLSEHKNYMTARWSNFLKLHMPYWSLDAVYNALGRDLFLVFS